VQFAVLYMNIPFVFFICYTIIISSIYTAVLYIPYYGDMFDVNYVTFGLHSFAL